MIIQLLSFALIPKLKIAPFGFLSPLKSLHPFRGHRLAPPSRSRGTLVGRSFCVGSHHQCCGSRQTIGENKLSPVHISPAIINRYSSWGLEKSSVRLITCDSHDIPVIGGLAAPAPVVVCGPSGVGKGTLIEMLMESFPGDKFGFSVSHCTRAPRPGEVDGVHYHYTSRDVMAEEITGGQFIESANVHGNMYGTSFSAVETVQNSGKICILDIDVQGVKNVKKSTLVPYYVFVAPPSIERLEARLRSRGTEKEEDIQMRMRNSRVEIEYGMADGHFDKIIINDSLEVAFNGMKEVFLKWYPHLKG